MATKDSSRELAVILHADVMGSTDLVRINETLAHDRIRDAFRRFGDVIRSYGGRIHEVRGDALLATFPRASDAVAASLAYQATSRRYNDSIADEIRPWVRIGIALGEVVIADGTLTGPNVVVAQRVEQLADPGGICIQGTAYDTIPARLQTECTDLGEQALKGFDAPVRVYAVELRPAQDIPAPEYHTLRRPTFVRRFLIGSILTALLVAGGYVSWLELRRVEMAASESLEAVLSPPDSQPAAESASHASSSNVGRDESDAELRPTLIVLPFHNISNNSDDEYFSDGFTEDVIIALARIPGLLVSARNTAFTYKDKATSAKLLREELGVRYVLEGSVRRQDDKVRVNAQLVDTESGKNVWAERFDRPLADIFVVQDELVDLVVGTVASHLRRHESERALSAPKEQLAAYDLSIKARYLFKRNEHSDIVEARSLLRRAIEVDPSYAFAYSLLGEVENYFFTHRVTEDYASDETSKRMVEATSRAVALSPNDAYAHSVHGIALRTLKQYDAADREAEQALTLAPNDPDVLFAVSVIKLGVGDYEGTVATVRRAWALDPFVNPLVIGAVLSQALFAQGKFEESKAAAQFCLQRVPTDARCQESLVRALGELGPRDDAEAAVSELLRLSPGYTVSEYLRRANKNRNDSDAIERWANGLRTAGVPD